MHVNDESGKAKTRKGVTAALDGHEVTEDDVVDFEVEEGGNEEDAGPAGALEALFRGLGSFVTDHADDQGLCMSMHQVGN